MNKRTKLNAFYAYYKNTPFSWEDNNCAGFASQVVKQLHGIDFSEVDHLINGKSKFQILYNLRKRNQYISDIITDKLGQPIDPKLAKPGDIVVEGEGYEENVGICYDVGWSYFQKENGLMRVLNKYCSSAWRCK